MKGGGWLSYGKVPGATAVEQQKQRLSFSCLLLLLLPLTALRLPTRVPVTVTPPLAYANSQPASRLDPSSCFRFRTSLAAQRLPLLPSHRGLTITTSTIPFYELAHEIIDSLHDSLRYTIELTSDEDTPIP
ncbi:hypothetical protein CMUS01_14349 [Colletotrichum musicola]|uniref:Uncharacterized protein n=1 Tax=Colletotrichum musicola TaxID=2175873 RepID=A0A8H6J5F1_9PEZI|nr:hypothetical protein CMUS01_14349 [Colletotrichum musicola]